MSSSVATSPNSTNVIQACCHTFIAYVTKIIVIFHEMKGGKIPELDVIDGKDSFGMIDFASLHAHPAIDEDKSDHESVC